MPVPVVTLAQVLQLAPGEALHGVQHVQAPQDQQPGLIRFIANKVQLTYPEAARGRQNATSVQIVLRHAEELNYFIDIRDSDAIVYIHNLRCRRVHLAVAELVLGGTNEFEMLYALAVIVSAKMADVRANLLLVTGANITLESGNWRARKMCLRGVFVYAHIHMAQLETPIAPFVAAAAAAEEEKAVEVAEVAIYEPFRASDSVLHIRAEILLTLRTSGSFDAIQLVAMFITGVTCTESRWFGVDALINGLQSVSFSNEGVRTALCLDVTGSIEIPTFRALSWYGLLANAATIACKPLVFLSLPFALVQFTRLLAQAKALLEDVDSMHICKISEYVEMLCTAKRTYKMWEALRDAWRSPETFNWETMCCSDWVRLIKEGILGYSSMSLTVRWLKYEYNVIAELV